MCSRQGYSIAAVTALQDNTGGSRTGQTDPFDNMIMLFTVTSRNVALWIYRFHNILLKMVKGRCR